MNEEKNGSLEFVEIKGETFLKISNSNELRPFFMSIVSDSNHWMFISSNGGLSAGRKNSNHALFPYYTDDKITESADITGSKSIFWLTKSNGNYLWEPFSARQQRMYRCEQNLYKSKFGNKILFEEINHDLELSFRYEWSSSNRFGFVRNAELKNLSDQPIHVSLVDGIQNILPHGVESDLQNRASNLVDAYKRSELERDSGMAIFALSAIIVDKAEPSEALKANIAWSTGLANVNHLLSPLQLDRYRTSGDITGETDIKGEKGAYLLSTRLDLEPLSSKSWMIVANVNQSQAQIVELIQKLQKPDQLTEEVRADIKSGTDKLIALNASADGLQLTDDRHRDTRHFANSLFNIMRGGVFDFNYNIHKWDFEKYIFKANNVLYKEVITELELLPELFSLSELRAFVGRVSNPDFTRLAMEYLPLKFSRRHGDPSRPWNRFSINTHSEVDGSKILDYEGNWRDIFQNWEALAHSYPQFIEGMIAKFLNASTFDGYNPYRVTKDGFDWETIEPDDPWSYIGYWGDHQIIYLLKFLEFVQKHNPSRLSSLFDKDYFVYAHVPYNIKPYEDLYKNPKDTIDFDHKADAQIRTRRTQIGADGALLCNEEGHIHRVNFIEKILATVLAKLSNFIPEGGIWMNTQRPEWNDANNALVGNGVSMVTLYYLHRFMQFFQQLLENTDLEEIKISSELVDFYKGVRSVLAENEYMLSGAIDDERKKFILDKLGKVASDYRWHVYQSGFWGKKRSISIDGLKQFTQVSLSFIRHTIRANKRKDGMYHAYNLMTPGDEAVHISYLTEMLEGQVAVLSSKYLDAQEALEVLNALKKSALFREDQYSYLLYPNKDLPGFLRKNIIPRDRAENNALIQELVRANNHDLIQKDVLGSYHFNGNFRNANDVKKALDTLSHSEYKALVQQERSVILSLFEKVFNHKAFTGRSGTFFGYEGLGSIYWHMVSKLLLAVQECCLQAIVEGAQQSTLDRLLEHYYEIQAGIGVHKSPELYGAFPTDPYSHTPAGRGAQQPGMTGQVKEDVLCRFGELGVVVEGGQIHFRPYLLRKEEEFLTAPKEYIYVDVNQKVSTIPLPGGTLAFTYCQVPVVYILGSEDELRIYLNDGDLKTIDGHSLTQHISEQIFGRTGEVKMVEVVVKPDILK